MHRSFIFNSYKDNESSCPHDCLLLVPALQARGFHVTYLKINTFTKLSMELDKAAKENYTNITSLWVFVLAPGSQGQIRIGSMCFSLNFIVEPFLKRRCPSLANKPKIFAIQTSGSDNFKYEPSFLNVLDLSKSSSYNVTLPLQANLLVFYSSFAVKCAKQCNSCFLQEFCKKLDMSTGEEITEIFLSIMSKIQEESTDYCTGVPIIFSTIFKKFYLK